MANNTGVSGLLTGKAHAATIQARWLHLILLLVAIAGWTIFILACLGGPAWSPDGSQILFTYRDIENSRLSVALYDRKTGLISTIFAQPISRDGGDVLPFPRWQENGRRALISFWHDSDGSDDGYCQLLSLPIHSKLPPQLYALGPAFGCMYEYPIVGGKAYFSRSKGVVSVDLSSGEIERVQFKSEPKSNESNSEDAFLLFEQHGEIYYQQGLTRKIAGSEKNEEENGTELGRLKLQDFSRKPSFVYWPEDLERVGAKHKPDDIAEFAPYGNSTAIISPAGEEDSDQVLLAEDGKGLVRTLQPDLGAGVHKLGNVVWSSDGKLLYASALGTTSQKDVLQYSLAEIPLEGKARLTRICSIHGELSSDLRTVFRMTMEVSLSPDGRWAAMTPAYLGKGDKDGIDDGDRALFLIDLNDPGRQVKRVPIPNQPAPESAAKEDKP